MYSSYSNSEFFYYDEQTLPIPWRSKPILIPIETPSNQTLTSIPVHLPSSSSYITNSAVKIQSVYRGHLVRSFLQTIRSVDSDVNRIERLIQRQEAVDAIRDENSVERIRLNEMLMKLLIRLDSVPGFYTAVRDARRNASRRIVGLQGVIDAIVMYSEASEVEWEVIPSNLEQILTRVCL